MKEKLKTLWYVILVLLILSILGTMIWAVALFLKYVLSSFSNLMVKIAEVTSNMDAVVIVALITGMVSILGVIISSIVAKVLEYRRNTKRYLYEKREEPYAEFIEMVYHIQQNAKGNPYPEEQIITDMMGFSKKLTLWGSSRVIKKWLKFRELSQQVDEDNTKVNPTADNLFILEDIMFEIRKDMGQKKRGLSKGDLLAFFVNDIKNHIN